MPMNYFDNIIGQSPAFEALIRTAKMVANTDITVFIKGDTGTGKEILANAIQKHSCRANKPFVTLNCAALPERLVESELFGHTKGAFTGASIAKQGILHSVDGGTLFLDEINSLPISIQSKLLRFIESGECLAVGDTKPYFVDVRIIAATNADLQEKITLGEFRKDLFYRLYVVPLNMPPLRQRTEDIELLINHFMRHFARTYGFQLASFSRKALNILNVYQWHGNVRELRNLCERLSIFMPGKIIEPENLPVEYNLSPLPEKSEFILPEAGLNLANLEADMIHQALRRTNGNRNRSAKLLGLTRDTLLYRIQKHGLV